MRHLTIRIACLCGGLIVIGTSIYMQRFDRLALPHPSGAAIMLFTAGVVVTLAVLISFALGRSMRKDEFPADVPGAKSSSERSNQDNRH